ncbi:MAG: branched-chain amino acid ABC transporter permease [Rhodospirillaceae bacterium]|nr:branched-chain amino acid ABC transporter permease [Rhodospirillaceae bacterium]
MYEISLLTVMSFSVIFALSLNLITGFCGQISLGHAAFYGIGAYTAALFTTDGGSFWLALPLAMAVAGFFGFIVGFASLRVRHDFLAITTMGVGFLFTGFVRQQEFLGGEEGIAGIPDPGIGQIPYMLLCAAFAAAVIAFSLYVKRSWMGQAFDAIATDEDTARTLGVDVARYKLTAFVFGTALAGLAGALFAHYVKFVEVESFDFIESISVLAMVIVGGIGSVWGVVVAAAFLSVLPLLLQVFADYKLLIYGVLLFAVMYFAPGGIDSLMRMLWRRISGRRTAE